MITRRLALLAGLGALATPAEAQTTAHQLLHSEGRYLPLWLEVRDSDDGLRSQFASFVGAEARALADAREQFGAFAQPLLGGARAQSAIEAIVEASYGRQVVMINEAHVASRHRSFLAQVLRALRPIGFSAITCLPASIQRVNRSRPKSF